MLGAATFPLMVVVYVETGSVSLAVTVAQLVVQICPAVEVTVTGPCVTVVVERDALVVEVVVTLTVDALLVTVVAEEEEVDTGVNVAVIGRFGQKSAP